jgi:hypothetical protein
MLKEMLITNCTATMAQSVRRQVGDSGSTGAGGAVIAASRRPCAMSVKAAHGRPAVARHAAPVAIRSAPAPCIRRRGKIRALEHFQPD